MLDAVHTEIGVGSMLDYLDEYPLPGALEIVRRATFHSHHVIYFILRHADVPHPKVGFRVFNDNTKFAGVQDFLDELWNTPDLIPMAIAA
jgi:hypothetical protein